MVATKAHPGGPKFSGAIEDEPRHDRKVMPARPHLNALGPSIPEWWKRELTKIDERFVLQYNPTGHVLGSKGTLGFWAVCIQLPRSKLLFKQHVLPLVDDDGFQRMPTAFDLTRIRAGWNIARNEGFYALFDAIDRNADTQEAAYEQQCEDQQLANVDAVITEIDPYLNSPRICTTPHSNRRLRRR